MYSISDWEEVGTVYVDSGCIMVGDPCYTQGKDASSAVEDWDDFLKRTWPKDFGNGEGPSVYDNVSKALGEKGIGIVVSSGYGDGEYPVFVKKNDEGRIAAVMVEFISEED